MQSKEAYQDRFLRALVRSGGSVTVFLVNGYQLRGRVTAFDAFVVCLETEGRQQMIFKHAISTLAPLGPVQLD